MQSDTAQKHRQRLVEMRTRLIDEIRRLDNAVAEHAHVPGDLSHVPTHPADHDGDDIETTVSVEHSEMSMLNQVDAALGRIEEGLYGQCQDCGHEIPADRLDAIPYATRCVPCEEKHESES